MGRIKKSTRKFEKNHLKRTLDDRKAHAKVKQQHQIREKKKKRRKEDYGEEENGEEDDAKVSQEKKVNDGPELFEDMSVEQFFQGGFEIPEAGIAAPKEKKKSKKENSSVKEKKKTGKRKRSEEEVVDKETKDGSEAGSEEGKDDDGDDNELDDHMADLAALADKDPDFYKYLKENDAELLDFTIAENDDLSAVDELSEGEDEEKPKKKKKKTEKSKGEEDGNEASIEVGMEDVGKWKKALVEEKSLRCLRKIVLAFRAAAHVNDLDEEQKGFKYSITNPEVYHELLVLSLQEIPGALNHYLPIKESASGRIRVSTETKKYRALSPLLKSHSSSLLHLLPTLTDPPTQKLILNSILSLLPYFVPFRKFLRSLLKSVIEIWSTHSNDEATRITAFLVVRKTVAIGDEGLKSICLKALYTGFVSASRQTSGHTIKGINLMKNSAGEVVGMDGMDNVGYQAGFGYIRQLAVHLRSSITNNSRESYKTVYNWQYVHSLDFWSRVLSMHCDGLKEAQAGIESPLRPLIYPLVQVTLGAIKLIPTALYFPLRFYLIRSLIRISLTTGVYIPLAPLIFEVLSSAELKKKPKPSTLKPLDFSIHIRAPKSYLRTRIYQDGVAEQIVELFSEFYVLYAKSIAFPELAIPTIVLVKRFMKKSKNSKFNNALQTLIGKLEANSKWIEEKRSKVEFAPNKTEEVDGFLKEVAWEKSPLGAYVVSQRKVRGERKKMLEESEKDEREREKRGRGDEESDEDQEMVLEAESGEDLDDDSE